MVAAMAILTTRAPGRAWSLPNVLTYGRVAAVPVVVALLFWPDEDWMRWAALGCKWIVDKGVKQLLPMLPVGGQEVRK